MPSDVIFTIHSGQPCNQGRAVFGVTKVAGSGYLYSTPDMYGKVFKSTPEQIEAKYTNKFDDTTYYTA